MLIIEFKEGPNKGKQVVFPTPDNSKPEMDTISTDDNGPDLDYFKDLLNENCRVPHDRFNAEPIYRSPSETLWKKFLRLFRRSR